MTGPAEPRVAVITGGTRGLGFACAKHFGRLGYRVALTGRNQAQAESAAESLRADGVDSLAVIADSSNEADVQRLHAEVISAFGRADVLVNNAGAMGGRATEETSLQEWEHLLSASLTGTFLCSKTFAPSLFIQDTSAIVNISSVLASKAMPARAGYTVAKAGIEAFTKVTAAEWACHGVRVNAVAPGYIFTEKTPEAIEAGRVSPDKLFARTPAGRFGRQDEIAQAIAFLASDAAAYITGQTLRVDGGYSIYGAWWPAEPLDTPIAPSPDQLVP